MRLPSSASANGASGIMGGINVAGNEHLRSFVDLNCNNVLLTGEGDTIPINWFEDGTIEWGILWYLQTNGAEAAFAIEGDLIDMVRNTSRFKFVRDYSNHGRYRGKGNISGVHCVMIVEITNFEQLKRDGLLGYSTLLNKSRLDELPEEELNFLVDPSEEKHQRVQKTRARTKARHDGRRGKFHRLHHTT